MDQANQTSTPKYTKEYFIQKFEAIPEEEIGQGKLENHCALWHCGVRLSENQTYHYTPEADNLKDIIVENTGRNIIFINDDPRGTAKQNILNALRL